MIIQPQPPLHLTYCMNIHRGESWAENFAAIEKYAFAVKQHIGPDRPFGLGLRLGRRATDALAEAERCRDLRRFLHQSGLYVFTINGFPYGQFHEAPVKENVYAPDWRSAERRDYTILLASILAELLPEGVHGSISTVPGSYRPWIQSASDVKAMAAMLCDSVECLAEIEEKTGKLIHLGLEPEPDCYLESPEEVVRFFHEELLTGDAVADERILKHLGVCLDTCHTAMRFRDPVEVLNLYLEAGIRVSKIQLSAALETKPDTGALRSFSDPVYLHQATGIRHDGSLCTWPDLPAMGKAAEGVERVRVHYHLPLYFENTADIRSTADTLNEEFFELIRSGATEHLEIETYTFDRLPGGGGDVVDSIAAEYRWVLSRC